MRNGYLLLRNNKQTGPHNLDELLQLQLKPFDLVWVEGKSAAWRYPSELTELSPFVQENPLQQKQAILEQPAAQKASNPSFTSEKKEPKISSSKYIYVTLPGNKVVPQPAPAFTQPEPALQKEFVQKASPMAIEETSSQVNTKYSRSLNDVEEEYTNWIYKKKTRRKIILDKKHLAPTLLLVFIVAGACFALTKSSFTKSSVRSQSELKAQPVQEKSILNEPVTDITSPDADKSIPVTTHSSVASPSMDHKNNQNPVKKNVTALKQSHRQKSKNIPVQTTVADEKQIAPQSKDIVVEKKQVTVTEESKTTSVEKKKKLGDLIKGVFAKIKNRKEEQKNNAPVMEEPKHSEGRTSAKRDDVSTTDNTIDAAAIADLVDLSSNTPSNGWMMGVTDLKITLRNRSNLTIKSAAVNVLYYDQNDRLLEKKTIYFSNVSARTKQIVAAPDQKWADHTDYKLGEVSVKDDRVAKN